ncbi:MAG: DUF357 domain-containing protein [Candidatus Diapherotrites archaeon]
MGLFEELKLRTEKYEKLTKEALEKVKINAKKGTKEYELAEQFIEIAKAYFSDAKYYSEKGDNITALAAFSYAHAWLDAGVRTGFLKGENGRLFMQP